MFDVCADAGIGRSSNGNRSQSTGGTHRARRALRHFFEASRVWLRLNSAAASDGADGAPDAEADAAADALAGLSAGADKEKP